MKNHKSIKNNFNKTKSLLFSKKKKKKNLILITLTGYLVFNKAGFCHYHMYILKWQYNQQQLTHDYIIEFRFYFDLFAHTSQLYPLLQFEGIFLHEAITLKILSV